MEIIKTGGRYDTSYSYKEKHHGDFSTPLPYLKDTCQLTSRRLIIPETWGRDDAARDEKRRTFFDIQNGIPFVNGYEYGSSNMRKHVYNEALSDCYEKLGYFQGFFEDWHERQSAINMIAGRSRDLLRFIQNPKKFLGKAGKNITKRQNMGDIPGLWLEYNFAVKPLIGSIESSMELLTKELPTGKVRGRSDAVLYAPARESDWSSTFNYRKEIGVKVVGYNPNLNLAANLGLDKPITSAWAVVPWSWAIDYFVNVGDFLSNMEPRFPGLVLKDWYETTYVDGTYTESYPMTSNGWEQDVRGTFSHLKRKVKISPSFKFTINPDPLNVRRASYLTSAVALTAKGKSK